jgi:hypothetical protein
MPTIRNSSASISMLIPKSPPASMSSLRSREDAAGSGDSDGSGSDGHQFFFKVSDPESAFYPLATKYNASMEQLRPLHQGVDELKLHFKDKEPMNVALFWRPSCGSAESGTTAAGASASAGATASESSAAAGASTTSAVSHSGDSASLPLGHFIVSASGTRDESGWQHGRRWDVMDTIGVFEGFETEAFEYVTTRAPHARLAPSFGFAPRCVSSAQCLLMASWRRALTRAVM